MGAYVLSQQTAAELNRLIDERRGGGTGTNGGGGARQVCYVQCKSWLTGTTPKAGTCRVAEYNAQAGQWAFFGTPGDSVLLSAADGDLEVDKLYSAIRYGSTPGGKVVFVAFPGQHEAPELGCGLEYDLDDKIAIVPEDLAGNGLAAGNDCKINVVPGCAITLEGGAKVSVDASALAGLGLEATDEQCKKLQVKQGCGITIDAQDAVTVFTPDIAGVGLQPGNTPCQLEVKPGCGITFDGAGAVTVFTPDIYGVGLQPGNTPCRLEVKAGCGIAVGALGVSVDAPAIAGPGLVPLSPCSLAVNPGCHIKVEDDKVAVDVSSLRGVGLSLSEDACPKLKITPGCHVSLEGGDKVGVVASSLAGCGLTTQAGGGPGCEKIRIDSTPVTSQEWTSVEEVTLAPSHLSCGFVLTVTYRRILMRFNSCGVPVSVDTSATSQRTTAVNLPFDRCSGLCTYCQGYNSGNGPGNNMCWNGTGWVACENAPQAIPLMEPPTL